MNITKTILCLLLLSIFSKGFSQNSSSILKQKKDAITKEIDALKKARDQTDKNKKISLEQINLLNVQIHLREEKIKIINAEVSLLNDRITQNANEVKSLQCKLGKLKQGYAKMILFAQHNQSARAQLMFIFAADDLTQAYKRLKYIQQVSQSRKKKASEIQNTQQDINKQIVVLDKNKKEKNHLLFDQIDEKQTLGKDKATQSKVLVQLTKEEEQLKEQLATKQKEAKELNIAIQAAIRREILAEQRKAAEAARLAEAKAKKEKEKIERERLANRTKEKKERDKVKTQVTPAAVETKSKESSSILSSNPETAKLSHSFTENKSKLPNPVQGSITEKFGTHTYKNITVNNPGITIKTAEGAPVYAIFNGQVSNVLFLVNSYTVIIRHGEYFSIYSKLKNATVAAGQKIGTKQHIGNVFSNRVAGVTEMNFQIWKGSTPINPSSWISR
jgi:septal ring factor EnvC (AmiA/AmiB activator)